MIASLLANSQSVVAVIEVAGFIIMGLFAFTGLFGQKNNERRSESDQLADGLIGRLKETVEQQTNDIKNMSTTLDGQQKEIHQLQGQNEAYLKILSLRDPRAEKVFSEAPAIFEIAKENNELSRGNGKAITDLTNTLNKFIENLQPILIHLEGQNFSA